jgi:pyruvate/2-oxoglutarate dehydrogenase complex dihydrolipoamide acyltransferase (E2) component
MAYELLLPDIGEGLTEAEIVTWLVGVGETITANQPLVEVETDKALVEIPSPRSGTLLHVGGEVGKTIHVGDVLAVIGDEGELWDARPAAVDAPAPEKAQDGEHSAASQDPPGAVVKAMPLIRKLAAELGVDLATVAGSGPGGKITRSDVEDAAADASVAEVAPTAQTGEYDGETLSAMRRTIARNLTQSWAEIPHVTVWRGVDATGALAARAETGLLLEAILMKAILPVLAEFPDFNANYDGSRLNRSASAHIGIAVDTEAGLMVPVVRDAGTMNLRMLSAEIERLTGAARDRTLGLGELSGSTFTLSNVGAVGGGFGTPIIPYGTTAIVSVGRAEDEVIVRHGEIAIAKVFPVSLSFDHRVVDGAMASRFLLRYAAEIERYGLGN